LGKQLKKVIQQQDKTKIEKHLSVSWDWAARKDVRRIEKIDEEE
jgi:hypothetical protein